MEAFILAKNEEANIERSLRALSELGIKTTVLDSGSTDRTLNIASAVDGVTVRAYEYRNHCASYNQITTQFGTDTYVLILDADMIVSSKLIAELRRMMEMQTASVVVAPIEMWWEGTPMSRGSLYPSKPILFKTGREYFVASGHGELLTASPTEIETTSAKLIHDDRKGFEAYLRSQLRYAANMVDRLREKQLTWKDRIYLQTPLVMLLQPLYSYVVKGGFLAGRVGILYALDRLIASAIMLRQSVESKIRAER